MQDCVCVPCAVRTQPFIFVCVIFPLHSGCSDAVALSLDGVFSVVGRTPRDALCHIYLPVLDASWDFPAAFIYWISCLDF